MFKKHLSKKHEMSVGSDTINVDFLGSYRQFDWLEISLVFDKATNTQNFRERCSQRNEK